MPHSNRRGRGSPNTLAETPSRSQNTGVRPGSASFASRYHVAAGHPLPSSSPFPRGRGAKRGCRGRGPFRNFQAVSLNYESPSAAPQQSFSLANSVGQAAYSQNATPALSDQGRHSHHAALSSSSSSSSPPIYSRAFDFEENSESVEGNLSEYNEPHSKLLNGDAKTNDKDAGNEDVDDDDDDLVVYKPPATAHNNSGVEKNAAGPSASPSSDNHVVTLDVEPHRQIIEDDFAQSKTDAFPIHPRVLERHQSKRSNLPQSTQDDSFSYMNGDVLQSKSFKSKKVAKNDSRTQKKADRRATKAFTAQYATAANLSDSLDGLDLKVKNMDSFKKQLRGRKGKTLRRYGSDIDWGDGDDGENDDDMKISDAPVATENKFVSGNNIEKAPEMGIGSFTMLQNDNDKSSKGKHAEIYESEGTTEVGESQDDDVAEEISLTEGNSSFLTAISEPHRTRDDFEAKDNDLDAMAEDLYEGSDTEPASESDTGIDDDTTARGEKIIMKKEKHAMDESESEDNEFDENFGGSWDDAEEEYLAKIQRVLRENRQYIGSWVTKPQRRRIYRAITNGEDIHEVMHQVKAKNSKKTKPGKNTVVWEDEFSFSAELKAQTIQDRARKSTLHRARQEKHQLPHQIDLHYVNEQIRNFILTQPYTQELTLPSMESGKRAGTHLLAQEYKMSSRSVGKNISRTTVLQRTIATGVPKDRFSCENISKIIMASHGNGLRQPPRPGGKNKGLWMALLASGRSRNGKKSGDKPLKFNSKSNASGENSLSMKNQDGRQVGEGVNKLDEKNVGFRMLKQLGWSEGDRMGIAGSGSGEGLHEPLAATIKTSRRGLGG